MLSAFPDQVITVEDVVTVSKADIMVVSGGVKSGLFSGSSGLNVVISSQLRKKIAGKMIIKILKRNLKFHLPFII